MRKPEALLATRVANYLKENHPEIIYRFDIAADVPLPPAHAKRNLELHGKWNRGYPDLLICKKTKKYGGLYLELKATKKVLNSEHTRRQAVYHELLRKAGYKVLFTCGFDESTGAIRKYLS